MPRKFSEHEKDNIRKKLITACTDMWSKYGYKKTSVDELCQQVSISKGAFYLFYESKEALFCEVLCSIQQDIYETATRIISEQLNKSGVLEALRYVYRQYDRSNFLIDSSTADYIMLTNKLTPEQLTRIQAVSEQNRMLFLTVPGLRLKTTEELASSIIYSMIMTVKQKDVLPNHIETFDFLAEHLIDDIYE